MLDDVPDFRSKELLKSKFTSTTRVMLHINTILSRDSKAKMSDQGHKDWQSSLRLEREF